MRGRLGNQQFNVTNPIDQSVDQGVETVAFCDAFKGGKILLVYKSIDQGVRIVPFARRIHRTEIQTRK